MDSKAENTAPQAPLKRGRKVVDPNQPPQRRTNNGAPPPPAEYRWKKGQSGNPAGRKAGVRAEVRELVGENGKALWTRLANIALGNIKASTRDQIEAIKALADRGFGRVVETVVQVEADMQQAQAALGIGQDELLAIASGAVRVVDAPQVIELPADEQAEVSTENLPPPEPKDP